MLGIIIRQHSVQTSVEGFVLLVNTTGQESHKSDEFYGNVDTLNTIFSEGIILLVGVFTYLHCVCPM